MPRRKTNRIISMFGVSLLALLLIVGLVHARLLFPQQDFEYSRDYLSFQIYADRVIDSATLQLFDDVHERLQLSGFAKAEETYKVFLCYDAERFARYANKIGLDEKIQGFNLQPLGYTFISMSFVEEIGIRYGKAFGYGILEGDPAHVITHEIVHEQTGQHLGYLVDRNLARWKREGYCEYVATKKSRDSDERYELKKAARRFFNGNYENISPGRQLYISARLLTEFLLDEKKLSPPDFFQLETARQDLLLELQTWSANTDR